LDKGKKVFVKVGYLKKGSQGRLVEPKVLGERTDISIKDTHTSYPVDISKNLTVTGRLADKYSRELPQVFRGTPITSNLTLSKHINKMFGESQTSPNLDTRYWAKTIALPAAISTRQQFKAIIKKAPVMLTDEETKDILPAISMAGTEAMVAKGILDSVVQHKEDDEDLKTLKELTADVSEDTAIQLRRGIAEIHVMEKEKEKVNVAEGMRLLFDTGKSSAVHYRNPQRGQRVKALAYKIKKLLEPHSYRVTLAGSIRREVTPNDIDIVVVPRNKEKIVQKLQSLGYLKAKGDKQVFARIEGTDVDIYFTTPKSYGAELMTRTGPKGGNLGNRTLAKRQGMILNQYGLFKGNKRIAGKTEKEIYEALGKKYKVPELRGTGKIASDKQSKGSEDVPKEEIKEKHVEIKFRPTESGDFVATDVKGIPEDELREMLAKEQEKRLLYIDCPPGGTRPEDLLPGVLEGTGIPIKPDVGRFFGNWTWDYSDVDKETWKKAQPIIHSRLKALYDKGRIRYANVPSE
jgi:hypothetical protein